MRRFLYRPAEIPKPAFTIGDGLILLGLAALVYAGTRLALRVPAVIAGPEISLSYRALPWYAMFSVGRMLVAYLLSLVFSLCYGYYACRNRTAERVMMPLLDVLQSVPILSFLPVVILSLTAVLPQMLAAELAAIVLIFTSQAWNMTFSFYQSMTTIPTEQREAAAIFRLDPWLRFRTMELPFAALGLVWNSIMSWSGGWFFLMAAETFNVGSRDFTLPGLGSYLQAAANAGDTRAIIAGLAMLVLVILLLDQFVWRPVLAWADKFKVEMVGSEDAPTSWFLDVLTRSWLFEKFTERVLHPLNEWLDIGLRRRFGSRGPAPIEPLPAGRTSPATIAFGIAVGLIILYGGYQAVRLAATLPAAMWPVVGLSVLATFARVVVALAIALLWTIPVGVAIGTNARLAKVLQPAVQVVASIPATAIFPVLLLVLLTLPAGLNIAAILLMLLGTQWYLLFNIIAGSTAIPQDLKFTTELLQLSRWDRWRTLILPALFPFIITGAITASGGAWNASIVAERVQFSGQTYAVVGVGALISKATASGNYALLLVSTVALVGTVVAINRFFWRRMYHLAGTRYRME
jgi:NitT/TauT family transport system permease protein